MVVVMLLLLLFLLDSRRRVSVGLMEIPIVSLQLYLRPNHPPIQYYAYKCLLLPAPGAARERTHHSLRGEKDSSATINLFETERMRRM